MPFQNILVIINNQHLSVKDIVILSAKLV